MAQGGDELTHRGRVMYIRVNKLCHDLNQCRCILNVTFRNKSRWDLHPILYFWISSKCIWIYKMAAYFCKPQYVNMMTSELMSTTRHNIHRQHHYDDVTWTSCCLKLPVIRVFVHQLAGSHIKEILQSVYRPFVRRMTRVFPLQRAYNAEKSSIG